MSASKDSRPPEQDKDLESKVELLEGENSSLQRRLDKALAEIEALKKELAEALRSLKDQVVAATIIGSFSELYFGPIDLLSKICG